MTNIDDLVIDRSNFQQNRRAYGITLAEIADKSKISSSVISNFENFTGKYTQTRVRDDNQRIIIRALKDLIQDKIDSTFFTNNNLTNIKEEKEMENLAMEEISLTELAQAAVENDNKVVQLKQKYTKKGVHSPNGYIKKNVVEKLRKYCKEKDLGITEFCDMCGVNRTTLSPYNIKLAPILRGDILEKICQATGLDINTFNEDMNGDDENNNIFANKRVTKITNSDTIKENIKSDTVPTIKNEEKITVDTNDSQIRDRKYTFQDGKYYEEYTVISYVKNAITKEQFLNAIQAS